MFNSYLFSLCPVEHYESTQQPTTMSNRFWEVRPLLPQQLSMFPAFSGICSFESRPLLPST
jgi:hypothetical protein